MFGTVPVVVPVGFWLITLGFVGWNPLGHGRLTAITVSLAFPVLL